MFEASHTERVSASASDVWELWADPGRWAEWNDQVQRAESDAELLPGATVSAKLRRGGTVRYTVTALEPGRLLIWEARLPGARQGHEHRVEPRGGQAEVTHRLFVRGPLWPLFALLLGRKRMRESVVAFADRERALVEGRTG
jgi:uncharacterized protein YndB with AHSA1/START domain